MYRNYAILMHSTERVFKDILVYIIVREHTKSVNAKIDLQKNIHINSYISQSRTKEIPKI